MTRIYIDTNVFLDFYQSATDRLDVFRELVLRADKLLLPQQTIQEFRRNRVGRLSALVHAIRKTSTISIHTTSVVRDLPEFAAWQEARSNAKNAAGAIAGIIEKWIADERSDFVLAEFEKLVLAATNLPTTDQAFSSAQRRKLLGNPPTSPDKYTIGDELIWETLLAHATTDLVIVSRDKTFLDNQQLLRREYEFSGSRKLVLVTQHLRDAFTQLAVPSKTIERAEQALEATRETEADAMARKTGLCPKCAEPMDEDGYDGSDGDQAWWLSCSKCGRIVVGQ